MRRDAISVKQIEYKNAELVLCEFMSLQDYNEDEWRLPKYKDFNLQEFHDFVADKIEAFTPLSTSQEWKQRWPYRKSIQH